MPLMHAEILYPVSENNIELAVYTITFISLWCAGVKVSAEDEKGNLKFRSAMSDDDFFKWLRSKGISEKDGNTLIGM